MRCVQNTHTHRKSLFNSGYRAILGKWFCNYLLSESGTLHVPAEVWHWCVCVSCSICLAGEGCCNSGFTLIFEVFQAFRRIERRVVNMLTNMALCLQFGWPFFFFFILKQSAWLHDGTSHELLHSNRVCESWWGVVLSVWGDGSAWLLSTLRRLLFWLSLPALLSSDWYCIILSVYFFHYICPEPQTCHMLKATIVLESWSIWFDAWVWTCVIDCKRSKGKFKSKCDI